MGSAGRNQNCRLPRSSQSVHLSLTIERIQKTKLFKCCDVVIPRDAFLGSSFNIIPSRLRQKFPGLRLKVCHTHHGHLWTFRGITQTKQTKPSKDTSEVEERVEGGYSTKLFGFIMKPRPHPVFLFFISIEVLPKVLNPQPAGRESHCTPPISCSHPLPPDYLLF